MAKNIVIAVLALLTLTSFTYAYYQRTLMERALAVAEANADQARVAEREAMVQRELANAQYERAQQVVAKLEEDLKKSKK